MSSIHFLNEESETILRELPEITYAGNPVLRTTGRTVTVSEGIVVGEKLITTLARYRELTGLGRGLAAQQIGSDARVFVTFVDNVFKVYINPEIVSSSEAKNLYREKCISSSHMWCDIARPETITIRFVDVSGIEQQEEAAGFLARLLQHEYDHTRGILNLDIAVTGGISYVTGEPAKEVLRPDEIS